MVVGIIGSGFEDIIERRRENNEWSDNDDKSHVLKDSNPGDSSTLRGSLYNFLHVETTPASKYFDNFINFLVVASSLSFMFETVSSYTYPSHIRLTFDIIEFLSVTIFTVEYALRLYSIAENPKYEGLKGRMLYARSFLAIVNLLSFLPYWINALFSEQLFMKATDRSIPSSIVQFLRMFRLLRFEKYTKAFTTFDDIIRENQDVLNVTLFSALLMWILFSAVLYFCERNNPNEDMANFYKSVPHAMWITLLNLSGEKT